MSTQLQFTLKQLTYFVAAGEAGSILKAAHNIHVSQLSISNAIAHLESVFKLQFFIRHHAQGMSLTTAGNQVIQQTKRLLRDANELKGFAGKLSDQIFGSINIGCFIPLSGHNPGLTLGIATLASIRKTIVVDIFSEFCREHISTEKIPGMANL